MRRYRKSRKQAHKLQGGRCFWCNHRIFRPHESEWHHIPTLRSTADHLIPQSQGGGGGSNNIVAACPSCNGKRGNMPIEQWIPFLIRNIHIWDRDHHVAMILPRLSRFGITLPSANPDSGPDSQASTADRPPPMDTQPAPQGQPGTPPEG